MLTFNDIETGFDISRFVSAKKEPADFLKSAGAPV